MPSFFEAVLVYQEVEEFATKIVNEVRIPPSSFPLTGGERAMAQEIGRLTERAEQSLQKAEKLSRDLVEKSAIDEKNND